MTEDQPPQLPPIVVPHTELSADALIGVIESFVLREGTDYGERDVPFETKVLQVRRQLERRDAEIVFDPNTETIDIVVRKSVQFEPQIVARTQPMVDAQAGRAGIRICASGAVRAPVLSVPRSVPGAIPGVVP